MVRLLQLLGAASELHFECMYTKHKTQKRKTWHDGFVSLYAASRKLVLCEDAPVTGTVLEDCKISFFDWDKKDEEFITLPGFLVDIINLKPIEVGVAGNGSNSGVAAQSYASSSEFAAPAPAAKKQFTNPSFKAPGRPGPPRLSKDTHRFQPTKRPPQAKDPFDFAKNPTSEWHYAPNRTGPKRSYDDVLALF